MEVVVNLKLLVLEDVKDAHQDLLSMLELVLLVKVKIVEIVMLINLHAKVVFEDFIYKLVYYVQHVLKNVKLV